MRDQPDPKTRAEFNRCYWRSRRGLLELDLLLPAFVRARFETLSVSERQTLRRLLDCEDQDIWSWFQQRSEPEDAEISALLALIRAGHACVGDARVGNACVNDARVGRACVGNARVDASSANASDSTD